MLLEAKAAEAEMAADAAQETRKPKTKVIVTLEQPDPQPPPGKKVKLEGSNADGVKCLGVEHSL